MRRIGRFMGVMLITSALAWCVACADDPGTTSTVQDRGGPQVISWERAVELVLAGSVAEASQTHDLRVYVRLVDGTEYRTTEPQIDAIFMVVEEAPNRAEIILSTE